MGDTVTKADWKLYRERVPEWQEAYMARLNQSYRKLLSGPGLASDKFWELDKRIRRDKKSPGVVLVLDKDNMIWDLHIMLKNKIISMKDLDGFSDGLRDFLMRTGK